MTDRERWQLRGPVRSGRLERRWYSRRCGADSCDTEERGDATTAMVSSQRSSRNPSDVRVIGLDLDLFGVVLQGGFGIDLLVHASFRIDAALL